jgi:hypothetical protein
MDDAAKRRTSPPPHHGRTPTVAMLTSGGVGTPKLATSLNATVIQIACSTVQRYRAACRRDSTLTGSSRTGCNMVDDPGGCAASC